MLATIRRYWIGLLVIVLVGLHASIVGVIRHQASLAKIDASCEVDLGQFLAFQLGKKYPIQLRLHAIVPLNHRMKSRQLIELNKAQIRQSLEEHLRQLDSKLLIDPYLADLKSQMMDVLVQTIGQSSIDDLVVTELRELRGEASLEFVSQGQPHSPRKLVATLRDPSEEETQDDNLTEADHAHASDDESAEEHDEGEPKSHASDAKSHGSESKPHAEAKSHGTAAKSHGAAAKTKDAHGAAAKKPSGGHAPAAKKPAAGGHGAPAKKPAKDAKKSGH